MLSLKQLVGRAVTLSRTQPMLWAPPLGVALLSTLTLPAGAGPSSVMAIVSGLIGLAMTLGWYALIVRADAGETPTWDDFFVAVGRFFSPVLLGSVAYVALILLFGLPVLFSGATWIGVDRLLLLQTQLQKQVVPALERMQTHPDALLAIDPAVWTTLNQLALVVLAIAIWYGILSVVLLFWKQAMVLSELNWRESWARSWQVVKEHFRLVMGMLTAQAIAFLFAALLGAMPMPFGIIGWFGLLGIHVISTISYTTFYVHVCPPVKKSDAESAASNSPVS